MDGLNWLRVAPLVVGAVAVLALGSCSFVVVEPGTVGVVTHFGAVQDEVLPASSA